MRPGLVRNHGHSTQARQCDKRTGSEARHRVLYNEPHRHRLGSFPPAVRPSLDHVGEHPGHAGLPDVDRDDGVHRQHMARQQASTETLISSGTRRVHSSMLSREPSRGCRRLMVRRRASRLMRIPLLAKGKLPWHCLGISGLQGAVTASMACKANKSNTGQQDGCSEVVADCVGQLRDTARILSVSSYRWRLKQQKAD